MSEISSRIIYCDSTCLVVNKIAGEAVEGAGKGMVDLPRLLAEELANPHWPQPAREVRNDAGCRLRPDKTSGRHCIE